MQPWHEDAFSGGILSVDRANSAEATKVDLAVYTNIYRNLGKKDFEYLANKYGINRDNITQVRNTTFKITFDDEKIYDEVVEAKYMQLVNEPIKISLPRARETPIKIIQCYICQDFGHYNTYCPTIQASGKPGGIPICRYCSKNHHSKNCAKLDNPAKYVCVKCPPGYNNHKCGSRSCPKYQDEIQKVVAKRNREEQEKNKVPLTLNKMEAFVNGQIDRALALTRDVVRANNLIYDEANEKDYFERSLNCPRRINKLH